MNESHVELLELPCLSSLYNLVYSRKGYSEVVLRQDTETFLRVIENAVRHFGGVPRLLNFDNLKASVIKADWYDPAMNPKLADFCRYYGMTPMPCRSYTPQHKGKMERGVGLSRDSASSSVVATVDLRNLPSLPYSRPDSDRMELSLVR